MTTTPDRSGPPTTAFAAPWESSYGRPDVPGDSSTDLDATDQTDETPARTRHIVDRFDGAAGLFVLRLVTAAIFGIRGLQKLQHLDITQQQFAQIGIPSANTMALVTGIAEVAIALALVFGVAIRAAGIGIVAISVGALVNVKWTTGNVFTTAQPGFAGELELLLAGVGVALIGLGGGGWGVDRRFRRR